MNFAEPYVSVVIVNWNGAQHLRSSLPSLGSQSWKKLQVIVVDNGSVDESESVVKELGWTWLPLERNIGLAPAYNRGAMASRGEILLFLNNDLRADSELVSTMVRCLLEDDSIFAVDAMQYDWDGNRTVHLACSLARVPALNALPEEPIRGLYLNQEMAVTRRDVVIASGANIMVRRSMFTRLGGFDERLPAGYEDMDLCWRAILRGWRIVFEPRAKCWHRVGSSSRSTEGRRMRFRGTLMGRLVVASKLLPLGYAFREWAYAGGGLLRDLVSGNWAGPTGAAERAKIMADCIDHLSSVVVERRQLYRLAGTSPEDYLEKLLKV